MGPDDGQPSAAVVEGTRQDDPEHVGAVGLGGRPEEGVDGRPVAVLPGTAGHPDPVVLDEHVVVGRGDVDPAPDDPLAVHRVGRGEPPCPAEDAREHARPCRGDVQDDEHGGGKTRWKLANKCLQRFHATG